MKFMSNPLAPYHIYILYVVYYIRYTSRWSCVTYRLETKRSQLESQLEATDGLEGCHACNHDLFR
jgi:hypothetical protein